MKVSRRQFLTATAGGTLAWGWGARGFSVPHADDWEWGQVRHVINRCTYGARPGDWARVSTLGIDEWLGQQLQPASIDDQACDYRTCRLETLRCPTGELFEYKEDFLWKELAAGKLLRACYSERQLFEIMVDFWTDHFNIDSSKGDCAWLKTADDRDVIRTHALGSFPAMLRASALGPAMLWYLDGRANQKRNPDEAPNENYARELLELHTLGVHGGYTQQDVMEIARCLTGWTVRTDTWFGKGRVEFLPDHHDNAAKRVLGQEIPSGLGAGDVDRVLEIVTAHPSTARYLATKLCRRFIGEQPDESTIALVASRFAGTGGDIGETLRALFQADAFRTPGPPKFKRPFRFIVSALRATGADIKKPDALLNYLARMGHSPFQFPSPDGYPEEAGPWHGTMLWRWHLAYALSRNEISVVSVDWAALREAVGGEDALTAQLLGQTPASHGRESVENGMAHALALASPAFQGC